MSRLIGKSLFLSAMKFSDRQKMSSGLTDEAKIAIWNCIMPCVNMQFPKSLRPLVTDLAGVPKVAGTLKGLKAEEASRPLANDEVQ